MVELETEALPAAPKLIRSEKAAPTWRCGPPAPPPAVMCPPPSRHHRGRKSEVGDVVRGGDVLCILEAMKMESEITAPFEGTVKEVRCQKGASVVEGDVLVVLEPVGHAAQPVVHKAAPAPAPAPPRQGGRSGRLP
jgi:biotin carboxyl carrier protein